MAPILSHDEARAFYDRFGARQDAQAFYEDPATAVLIAHGGFDKADAVFEFGCGTGRFAERLLVEHLPQNCRYRAVDVSSTMTRLAQARLARWSDRVEVVLTGGAVRLDATDHSFDRFVANYVLDLLSDDDIRALLAEAYRILRPGGFICLVGLTHGRTFFSRLVTWVWKGVHALHPRLVGGCRPIDIGGTLSAGAWRIRHRSVITSFGVTSEVVVAMPR